MRSILACLLALALTLPAWPAVAQESEPSPAPEAAMAPEEPAFAEYFTARGGLDTFGYPLTEPFDLLGFRTQVFQRRVIQLGPDGSPRLLNLLDQDLLPYTRINGSTFPANDPALAALAPSPEDPSYAERAIEFVRRYAPDELDGLPVRFFQAFDSTVPCEAAFPDGPCDEGLRALMNLEMWGLPTSLPAADPANPEFVYQRFQRGIMHYDATCGCTQGILLGSYFLGVLSGEGLPDDLDAQARSSGLYGSLARRPGPAAPIAAPSPRRRPPTAAPALPAPSRLSGLWTMAGRNIVPILPSRRGPIVGPAPARPPAPVVPPSAPAPAPVAGDREAFGVIVSGGPSAADVTHLLGQLGMRWWYSFTDPDAGANPPGLNRVRLLRTGRKLTPLGDSRITELARANPGAAWLIGNEPNVPGQDEVSPEDYAEQFHRLRAAIKAGDSSATIVAPNVLNWDFTCVACGGYTSGRSFVERFRAAYRQRHGGEPPVDAWGIHVYDIDWANLPMTHVDRVKADLQAARAYLRGIPEDAEAPIWVSEWGVIWGFDAAQPAQVDGHPVLRPAGAYSTAQVDGYIADLVGWLRSSGRELGIARSFLYATKPAPEPYADVTGGISLFDAPGVGARLTSSGQAYRAAAGG